MTEEELHHKLSARQQRALQEAMERLQEELYLEMKPKYRTRAAEFHRRFRETTLRRQREQQKGERNHDA